MRKVKGRLLIQFAANDPVQLAEASELAKPYVDGIDLNCGESSLPCLLLLLSASQRLTCPSHTGCPQKWAYHEGIGCALLRKPDLVRDLVRTTKQRLGWDFPVSVKIRIDDDPTCAPLLSFHPPSTTADPARLGDTTQKDERTRDQSARWRRRHPHCARPHAAPVV